MDEFVIVTRKGPEVRVKIKYMLDTYKRLPLKYQSEIGCDSLIQNVFVKEVKNIKGTTITNLDKESKMKNSGIKYLEGRLI